MQLPAHSECSSVFLPTKPEPIFLESWEVLTLFHFINFSCEGNFFFGQSSKRLSADHLRCEHRHFYTVTSVGLLSYILADLGPRGELLKKQRSFLVQPMRNLRESRYKISHAYFRLLLSRLQASTKRTYARDTGPFSNGTPPSQLRTN